MTRNQPLEQNNPLSINIVQISTDDINGGAAIAAYRLYNGLKLFNLNVRMLVKNKNSTNPDIIPVLSCSEDLKSEQELYSNFVHQECINKNRTSMSTTLFSYPIFGYDFEYSELLKNAHIINLHWINFFCSLSSLKKFIELKKPIIWTLHDQWLLTGGCHYTSGCDKNLNGCLNCPQLINDERFLPHYFLQKKRELTIQMKPVVVTPSHWLADIVKNAPIFKGLRIEVIPNSVDTSIYINTPKKTARKRLNLPMDGFYLLFSVTNANEKRKGICHLISALKYCMDDPIFSRRLISGEIKIICFGDQGSWENDENIPIIFLGKIKSDSNLSWVYSTADVFLFPSVEDNLPNVVIEAMSCGTPTIAFNIGGIPDMIQNGINGYIVEPCSESGFAKKILSLMNDPEFCLQMSKNCRTIAIDKFSPGVQAMRYLKLYAQLMIPNDMKTGSPMFSTIQQAYELLPDASDIATDEKISAIIKETAEKLLGVKKIEFELKKPIGFLQSLWYQTLSSLRIR